MARRPPSHVVLAATFALGICQLAFAQTPVASIPPPAVAPAGSLYERLGGTAKVSAFVGVTIERTVADPALNRTFDKVNLQHVKDMLVLQICSVSGGGCTYTGDTMRDVHAGHKITNAEFAGLVEVLRDAMRAQDVPLPARNELLALLAPMKRDVVKL
ncbi:MAG: group 1 truncated hemoglobin [Steroidobacteraceae bacterium]|nr:group 1 truncated hemoglobin [Steroidobacteraceae bacterium]